MVVRTQVDDGIDVKTRTYRDIYKTKGLAEVREGFYAQREHCRWGVMVQLKGRARIVLGRFGDVPLQYLDMKTAQQVVAEQKATK